MYSLLEKYFFFKAKKFRDKYSNGLIPVDIEKIVEFKLGMEIIPIPGLKKNCDTDAFITSNWKAVSVNNESYLNDNDQNRLKQKMNVFKTLIFLSNFN